MKDTIVGIFEDREAGSKALEGLMRDGWDAGQVSVRRVLSADYRGLGDGGAAHDLMHAPPMPWDSTVKDDAGVVIVVVDVREDDNPQLAEARLRKSEASDIHMVDGTPALDL